MTLFPAVAFGQITMLDSVLYKTENPVPPSPYQAELDSLFAAHARVVKEALEDSSWVHPPHPEYPEFAVDDSSGTEITVQQYLSGVGESFPEGLRCFVSVQVEWNGQISEARLTGCLGEGWRKVDLRSVMGRIKVTKPGRLRGIPYPIRMSFSVPIPSKDGT